MDSRTRSAVFLLTICLGIGFSASIAMAGSGKVTFSANCASCHGAQGKGNGPAAKSLTPRPANLTKSRLGIPQIIQIIRNGKGACPSWRSSLKKKEVAALAKYTKSLQTKR